MTGRADYDDLAAKTFLRRAAELDVPLAARFAEAHARGSVLRHAASLDHDGLGCC